MPAQGKAQRRPGLRANKYKPQRGGPKMSCSHNRDVPLGLVDVFLQFPRALPWAGIGLA